MAVPDRKSVVIGLGKTGWSCAHFLRSRQQPFLVMDTRETPPGLAEFRQAFPDVPVYCGELDGALLQAANEIIVSPGVSTQLPALAAAQRVGVPLVGDIELFARTTRKPVLGITGSNAKSTVTTLVGEMARAAGLQVAVGGNLGTPALDLLDDDRVDTYVMELSSFQLETTQGLHAEVAVILNISEDHMDRYATLAEYVAAKQRIYRDARHCVWNRDDRATVPPAAQGWTFGLDQPDSPRAVGLIVHDGSEWLVLGDGTRLLCVSDIRLPGRHNLENVAAAFAIAAAAGWPLPACAQAVRVFAGLPHRCEWVADKRGVRYINDSKGTNIGATIAAIRGLATTRPNIVLLAGGDGKGADFTALAPAVHSHVRQLVLIGRDAALIARACDGVPVHFAASMEEAVQCAAREATVGDVVLLSPACASFDMFQGYDDRGRQYCRAVEALPC